MGRFPTPRPHTPLIRKRRQWDEDYAEQLLSDQSFVPEVYWATQAPAESRSAGAASSFQPLRLELGAGRELLRTQQSRTRSSRQPAACPEFTAEVLASLLLFPVARQAERLMA